ncbi:MAG: carboxypeptidase-like regulatory domain-containing protein, partial [Chitinophagaceae bacterium]
MNRYWLMIILLCLVSAAHGQNLLLKGHVYSSKMEPIPLVDVRIKTLQRGTVTNELGYFELSLAEGRYELVYSAPGFKTLVSVVILQKDMPDQQVLLEEDGHLIGEVSIVSKRKDQSKDVIRKTIEEKDKLQQEVGSYRFEAYIKAFESADFSKMEAKPKKGKDSVSLAREAFSEFAEVMLQVDRAYPDKIKEERVGVNIKGNKHDFYYLSCTEGDYNFYANLIRIPSLSIATFLSPLSRAGLIAYRYKYLGLEADSGKMLHHIYFKPSQSSNALFEGEVWIEDGVWAIRKMKAAFPNHQTPEFKSFEATVTYERIQDRMWLPVQYDFSYQKSANKKKGRTLVKFDKYVLDTAFKKSYFNTEVSATSDSAYHRDTTFWSSVRSVPLTTEEIKVIRYRDSIYEFTHSEKYQDSMERKNNKLTLMKVVWFGQGFD